MYKKKCLFRNSNASWGHEASALESVWAYLSSTGDTKITGRYRIRITKMSSQELIAMGLAPDETPPDFFGLQASLDKWHADRGWLPMFDWVGDPESSLSKIEKDLNKQFQAFVTGISSEEDFSFDLPKPKPKKKAIKLPEPPTESKDKEDDSTPDDDGGGDAPDFEWL